MKTLLAAPVFVLSLSACSQSPVASSSLAGSWSLELVGDWRAMAGSEPADVVLSDAAGQLTGEIMFSDSEVLSFDPGCTRDQQLSITFNQSADGDTMRISTLERIAYTGQCTMGQEDSSGDGDTIEVSRVGDDPSIAGIWTQSGCTLNVDEMSVNLGCSDSADGSGSIQSDEIRFTTEDGDGFVLSRRTDG